MHLRYCHHALLVLAFASSGNPFNNEDDITCHGDSGWCGIALTEWDNSFTKKGIKSVLEKIRDRIEDHHNETWANNDHLACVKWSNGPAGFCLFYENMKNGSNTIENTKRLLEKVHHAGCSKCMKARVNLLDPNDNGKLKIDYVKKVDCERNCKPR